MEACTVTAINKLRTPATAGGSGRIRNRYLAASNMAFSTVLKVLFAAWAVSNLSGTEASNSTSPPTTNHVPNKGDSESTTIIAVTNTETAPSAGAGDPTTELLTELGVISAITELTQNVTENQETTESQKRTEFLRASTATYSPSSPDKDVSTATAGGEMPRTDMQETATGMAAGIVRTPSALPTPIIDYNSIDVTPNAICLCLREPVGPEGSINYFLITESYLDGTRTWNISHDQVNMTTVCVSKRDLNSGTPYRVNVVAQDDDMGNSASDFLNITTALLDIEVGLDPVLELLDGNSTRVNINWSFRNLTHVERFIFSYNQTDKYPGGFQAHQPMSLHGGTRNITLRGVFPGASYDFRLQGISGPLSTTVLRRWIPETEPPSHLRAVVTTATATELTWTFPPHTPPPLVRHFMVSCKELPTRDHIFHWTNFTSIILHGLIPDTKYEVKVSTISINGRPSYPRNITTETGIAPPRILMYSATSTSFTLDWEPARGSYHHIVTCDGCPTPMQTLVPGVTRVTFDRLRSGNEYNGTLQAVKNRYAKSELTVYRKMTYPKGPPSVEVHLVEPYGTRLELSWRPTICAGCLVDSYTTSLWISETSYQVTWKHSDCPTGSEECRLVYDYLIPGQEYRAEVNAIRMGLMSQPATSSSSIRIPPATPGPITFPDVSYSKISLVWQPSRGILDKYIIGLCEVDAGPPTADCHMYMLEVNSSITEFKCLELKPDTRYNITLSSCSGGIRSGTRWVVKATMSHYPAVDSRPPKAPGERDVTPYTFPVTFDTSYFDNSDRDILHYTVLVAEASAVSHANLPTRGNLSEGLKTRTWAKVIGQETIQRYQIADRYSYDELTSESGKREAYAKRTIVIGEEECLEEQKEDYCNGPLKHNKIYVYQFRVFTATGYADTPFSRHVMLPEDNSGVVAGISVVLILLFLIVLVLIGMIMGRRFRGSYGHYMAARSIEPLPVRLMTRDSTSKRYSRPVRLTDFCHDFQVMNAHCHYGFSREYESIMKVGRKMTSHSAVLVANVSKNRYTNILPFDRTRVMLSPIDDVEGSDYINANYISGYDSPREYIACQGPLPGTVDDMWRMIWEQDVTIIVMLTQLIEKATVKCDQYWEEDNAPFLHGDIQVTLTNTDEQEAWQIRDFTLLRHEITKKVQHFHYLAWPDHGVPDCSKALLSFIRTVREQIPKKGNPTIVHCSAGVGRTGTFICLDRLMRHMEEYAYIDILSVTCDLRMHRSYMVQTEQQYVFIHKCVMDILEEKGITPKRLPSISSMDSNDMASTREGSDASAMKYLSNGNENDESEMVVFRSHSCNEDEDFHKRISTCSMGSPKRSLISSEDDDRSCLPKRAGSNGSANKKLSRPFQADVKEEFV